MNSVKDDAGLMRVLLDRYKKQRQPRAQALKEKVDQGEPLSNFDLIFLQEVSEGIHEARPFLNRYPECRRLATELARLCTQIAEKGVENEKTGLDV